MSRPRIRSIKPEMWHDEKIGGLTRDSRLLFVGLVTMADDEGRLRATPTLIVGHVFPYDDDAGKKLERWLDDLEEARLILRYEVGRLRYVVIRNWRRHQKINRAQPSELPPPPDASVAEANAVDEVQRSEYRKKAIPERTRREVARRAGCEPGETCDARCNWCGAPGTVIWNRLANGKPGSWVQFKGLELDHVIPEFSGGSSEPDNIVLACVACNRSRGHNGMNTESRNGTERDVHGNPQPVEDVIP